MPRGCIKKNSELAFFNQYLKTINLQFLKREEGSSVDHKIIFCGTEV
jgi:hypothetical protein